LRKKKKRGEQGGQSNLKNAEANLRETAERYPEAKSLLNMRLKDMPYKDPFDQLDPHRPARIIGNEVSTTYAFFDSNNPISYSL
jgi:hypothetical protein